MSEHLTVMLVDDETLVRVAIRRLLETEPGIDVVAEVGVLGEVVAAAAKHRPDVIVMDIEMSSQLCFQVLDELTGTCPGVRVILISGRLNDAYLELAHKTFRCAGILPKTAPPADLTHAIRIVADGGDYRHPEVRERLKRPSILAKLTATDRKLLCVVCNGRIVKQAALEIGISNKNADNRIQRIKDLTGLHTNVELCNFAHALGLLKVG